MNLNHVLHEFQTKYYHLTDFSQRSTTPAELNPELITETLEQLAIALEELSVTQEELLQQNQELATARNQLESQRRRYQDLFESAPDAYLVTDHTGTILEANRAAATLLGVPQSRLPGKPLIIFVATQERQNFHIRLNQLPKIDKLPEWELQLVPRSGEAIKTAASVSILYSEAEEPHWLWLIRDISERRRTEAAVRKLEAAETANRVLEEELQERQRLETDLRQSEARFRSLFENSPVAYQSLDEQGRYLDVNWQLCHLLGYSSEELLGRHFSEFCSPKSKQHFQQQFASFPNNGIDCLELELLPKNKTPLTVLLDSRIQRDQKGQFVKSHCILYNITERKLMEEALRQAKSELGRINEQLKRLVNIDSLTQIANRRCFDGALFREWQRLQREQQPLSLILFDIDYFKRYNDYYGHQQGDECIAKIAQAAQVAVYRPADLVARYGGEEFAVILPNVDQQGAIEVAKRIDAAIKFLGIAHQQSLVSDIVTVSFGIATLVPSGEQSPETLLIQADRSLYKAKREGRNQYAFFGEL